MSRHSPPIDPAFLGIIRDHPVVSDAGYPSPPPPLPSTLRVKTAAHEGQILHPNDNNAVVATLHTTDSTKRPANDTVAHCDKNNSSDSPSTQLLPLMPAMIGAAELCGSDVWSRDPEFMMYCYKVTPCSLSRTPHDWRLCPWAHPNERAARRCPRMYVYASFPCFNARSGRPCSKGHACESSHNITEYWLHPTRYRAEWCSLGLSCNRRLCFFAHSDAELRSTAANAAQPPPIVSQPPPRGPYLDLLASTADLSQTTQARSLPLQQHNYRQQRQSLPQQQQQQQQQQEFYFDPRGVDASCWFI